MTGSLDACAGHCPRCSSMRRPAAETTTSDWISRAICGTHKGHRCQEGVRIWPGGYVLPSGLG